MGVALPLPGSSTFHRMLDCSLQVVGGSPCGATPVASGPRHWCQLTDRLSANSSPQQGAAAKQIKALKIAARAMKVSSNFAA